MSEINNLHLWVPIFFEEQVEVVKLLPTIDDVFFWLDFEWRGKRERQKGWKRKPLKLEDIVEFKKVLGNKLQGIRVNPLGYSTTTEEVNLALKSGYTYFILPYFRKVDEAKIFLKLTARKKTILLIETRDAFNNLSQLVKLKGVYAFHLGLQDLSIELGKKFLLYLYEDGTVDRFTRVMKENKKRFGIGGIAPLDCGIIKGKIILQRLLQLGAHQVFLSSDFWKLLTLSTKDKFLEEIYKLRQAEKKLKIEGLV